ncbi:hypothetical protein LCGC14_1219390 [marine sediment metagenome]|uniref:Uncharacterized protein n=1 Tax=marine sediment metagenome TaxID=412755 RepID=A0A0F9LBU5_9ZZZZ
MLAKAEGFNITQFAVSDDEVDYTLFTTAHPLGTNFFGSIIENLPVIEASPDETQNLRFKLVTLPRGTKEIPIITVGVAAIVLTAGQANAFPLRPATSQGLNGAGFGYTAILFNSDAAILVGTGVEEATATVPTFLSDVQSANATVARGLEFTLTPRDVAATITTSLQIIGNQTGASITISVVVNPQPTV